MMKASVRVGGKLSKEIIVNNGLRHGCTLAPMLFNLYFSAVVGCWCSRCATAGVPVKYKIGRRLVGDRTAKSRLSLLRVTESQFADDAALYSPSRTAFEESTSSLIACASEWGLTVSVAKTKGMIVGDGDCSSVPVGDGRH